jgi:hypothetical protein
VIEVTSPETRKNDFGPKKVFYHQAGVPLYVIVDARPKRQGRIVKLHGFQNSPEGYLPLPLDDQNRLWIEPLGLWLKIEDRRVVCIDGATGEPIGGYVEQAQRRIDAEARLAEMEARADAEARTRIAFQSIAENAQARADAETRVRLALESRIEGQVRLIETQNRTVELQTQIHDLLEARLQEAEARIREMEAEIRRLRGEA